MHHRLRLATTAAVAAAVLLLGIPLGLFVYQVTQNQAVAALEARADLLRSTIEPLLSTDQPVGQSQLEAAPGFNGQIPAHVRVSLVRTGGDHVQVINAGVDRPANAFQVVSGEDYPRGVKVELEVSMWDMRGQSLPALLLVALASLAAIVAGVAVGSWQAKRLSEPLVFLAATAEQLGSGQLRVSPPVSGIEEIDLVTEELARSAGRMATRLAAESQFAADASHQLRTPLTALSMRLEEIELTSNQPEVREEARISLEQIDRLGATIAHLLERTRYQGAGTDQGTVPLGPVLVQQIEEWQPVYHKATRSLVLELETDAVVKASTGALTQVVATLLENSLQHGAGTTTLRGRAVAGGVAIEVGDQGEGVSDELASKVFDRNVTGGGGTGLGLAVARDLVVADGGRLELSNHQPAVFTVFLQVA